jgi:hypothetical protein
MRKLSFTACFALLILTILASLHSYRAAVADMTHDLDQALMLTMEMKTAEYITPDTVRTYRSLIKNPVLRQCATLSYCLPDERRTSVCSRKMLWQHGGQRYYLRGYANCSMATVLSLSDQRLPLTLSLLTLLSFVMAFLPRVRRQQVAPALISPTGALVSTDRTTISPDIMPMIGDLCYCPDTQDFFHHGKVIHFTPMQRQLMELFWQSDRHTLTKQEICDALWPRKDDANETLYTLIKRLKQTLADNGCQLQITSDRGRAYQLEDTNKTSE